MNSSARRSRSERSGPVFKAARLKSLSEITKPAERSGRPPRVMLRSPTRQSRYGDGASEATKDPLRPPAPVLHFRRDGLFWEGSMKLVKPPGFQLVLLFLAGAAVARAQGSAGVHFGIAGGATFPTQNAGDLYDTGYHGSVMLNFNAPAAPIGLRIEGMYARMDQKGTGESGHLQVGSGTANLVLGPKAVVFRPYFIGGGGFYRVKFSATGLPHSFEDTQNKFGWNVGGGFSFGVGPVATIFIEARYIQVQTEQNFTGNEHFSFIPVTVGFVF